jgi:hypothetical protein
MGKALVRGIETAYDEVGAAWGGPALVLLHGSSFDRSIRKGV